MLEVNRVMVTDKPAPTAYPFLDAPNIQMQSDKRLYGYLKPEERKAREGLYYRVIWRQPSTERADNVVFQFQRSSKKGKVERVRMNLPPNGENGVVEIPFAGASLEKGGRVLAWRVDLMSGTRSLATEKSYLWND